jgi:riboflavin kinase/FMN adenylyltransferase
MKILQGISQLAKVTPGCVLTIGNFDGVHLGHQAILAAARQAAADRTTELLAMAFEPHPLTVLYPDKAPANLTPLPLKRRLLAELQVDCLIVLQSTVEMLALTPESFVQRFLVENIRPSLVVEGESFNFGAGRAGSIETLRALAPDSGFDVSVVPARQDKLSTGQTITISSTAIRNMLENGSVADAATALGRPYRLIGRVIPGRGKGKRLGFPTANMHPLPQLIPAQAVYAGAVQIADTTEGVCKRRRMRPAALSIGRAQTLAGDHPQLIEAHILTGRVGDLHGKWLAMDFIERIRSQQKFKTETELTAQIAKDCEKAKTILLQDEH